MLVPLIIRPRDNLASVGLILLNSGILHQSNVVVNVEVEERSTFSPGLAHNKVVERVGVRDDDVLLDVHEILRGHTAKLVKLVRELTTTAFKEFEDGKAFGNRNNSTVATTVPVTVCDFYFVLFHPFLVSLPLPLKFLPQPYLLILPILVREEGCIDKRAFFRLFLLFGPHRTHGGFLLLVFPLFSLGSERERRESALSFFLPLLSNLCHRSLSYSLFVCNSHLR
mmetsp:Transcript_8656/g.13591  ORF Transcript_8656/g.13591 Transcript_8656/m.13591 type:complete len:225 (-) Transcript_8656:310-984(-)